MAPHPSRDQSGIEESSPSTSTVVVGAIKSATTHRRKHHDNLDARPELLSLAAHGHEGDTRDAGLRRQLRPQSQDARCNRRGRCRSQVEVLRAADRQHGHAQRRRRVAPLRLERLFVMPVSQRAARARRAPLSGGAGAQILPHPHLDTKPDPKKPKIVKVIEPGEVAEKAGYTRPHTVHCGPEGIYVAALGNREGKGPGGVFLMDHETFEVRGQWEMDRGPQHLAYDAWWHLGHDTLVTSEWGTPDTFEEGLIPEVLLGAKYGRRLHFWDLHKRKHLQTIDFGDKHQLVFELRPAHDPTKAYGFVNCVV